MVQTLIDRLWKTTIFSLPEHPLWTSARHQKAQCRTTFKTTRTEVVVKECARSLENFARIQVTSPSTVTQTSTEVAALYSPRTKLVVKEYFGAARKFSQCQGSRPAKCKRKKHMSRPGTRGTVCDTTPPKAKHTRTWGTGRRGPARSALWNTYLRKLSLPLLPLLPFPKVRKGRIRPQRGSGVLLCLLQPLLRPPPELKPSLLVLLRQGDRR